MVPELSDYLRAERGRASRLAADLGVSRTTVHDWANDPKKPVPVDRAMPIERATGGAVRRWASRPCDWMLHWPELVGAEEAPQAGDLEARVSIPDSSAPRSKTEGAAA